MKFISASRLRRAQDRILGARPYANRMLAVLNSLASRVDPSSHPLLAQREPDRLMLVVVTADKGLCGPFNSNIIRATATYIEDAATNKVLDLTLVGRKGADWFRHRPWPIRHQYVNIMSRVDYQYAREIAESIIEYYAARELDSIYLGLQ